jgi:hypothetical protein
MGLNETLLAKNRSSYDCRFSRYGDRETWGLELNVSKVASVFVAARPGQRTGTLSTKQTQRR